MNEKRIIRRKCPLCNTTTVDILKHMRIDHDIDDMETFKEKYSEIEKRDAEKQAFSKYVQELQEMEKSGTISAEDYRRLVMEWIKKHKT